MMNETFDIIEELHLTGEVDLEEELDHAPRERGIELGMSLLYSQGAIRRLSEANFLASIDRFHADHRTGVLSRFRHLKEHLNGKRNERATGPDGPGNRDEPAGPDREPEPGVSLPAT